MTRRGRPSKEGPEWTVVEEAPRHIHRLKARVEELLIEQDATFDDLATAVGVSKSRLSSVLQGGVVSRDLYERICHSLGVLPSQWYGGVGNE